MLRLGEAEQVLRVFRQEQGMNLIAVNAVENFLTGLAGLTEPEAKRKTIGRLFIELFSEEAFKACGAFAFWRKARSTPMSSKARPTARRRRPSNRITMWAACRLTWTLNWSSPCAILFKDEARSVGEALGLPESIIWRQPFPGPRSGDPLPGRAELGAAGEAAGGRRHLHRRAGGGRLAARGDRRKVSPCCCPVKSVGVMGDKAQLRRSYCAALGHDR